jgi:hypothetical protein
MFKFFLPGKLFCLVLVSVLCTGCMDSRYFFKYEPADDSFTYMQILTNIRTNGDGETEKKQADRMKFLWEKRESIIITPSFPFVYGRFWEKKDKNTVIDLSGETADNKAERATAVDLDSIKIMPGEFYLNAHKNLSYYHQIILPGKTFDEYLKEISPSIANEIVAIAEEQIKKINDKKEKQMTWDELRKSISDNLNKKETDKTNLQDQEDSTGNLSPFEMESLKLLTNAKPNSPLPFKMSRTRNIVTLTFPLTKRDCDEAIKTLAFTHKAVAEKTRTEQGEEKKKLAIKLEFLESITLRYAETAGLEAAVDIAKVSKLISTDVNPEPDANQSKKYTNAIELIEARGIKINRTFSIDKLIEKYFDK